MRGFTLAVLAAALTWAGGLSAQADLAFTGSVNDVETRYILFDVDFGASDQITIELDIAATGSTTAGLRVKLWDMDELALNGSATAEDSGSHVSFGAINLSLTTPTYSGVHQFAAAVETFTQGGASNVSTFAGTISTTSLTAGAITESSRKAIPYVTGYHDLLGRGGQFAIITPGGGTYEQDVEVDFGALPQSITFWVLCRPFANGTLEVYEVQAGGAEALLGSMALTSPTNAEDNFTSTTRDGVVRLRLKIITTQAEQFIWQVVLPNTVTSIAPPKKGGGGSSSGGCSTDERDGFTWLALLAALGALGLASRLRPEPLSRPRTR